MKAIFLSFSCFCLQQTRALVVSGRESAGGQPYFTASTAGSATWARACLCSSMRFAFAPACRAASVSGYIS